MSQLQLRERWFQPAQTRQSAESLLQEACTSLAHMNQMHQHQQHAYSGYVGCFLVRNSSRPNAYALSKCRLTDGGDVQQALITHYIIARVGNGLWMLEDSETGDQNQYGSVDELVAASSDLMGFLPVGDLEAIGGAEQQQQDFQQQDYQQQDFQQQDFQQPPPHQFTQVQQAPQYQPYDTAQYSQRPPVHAQRAASDTFMRSSAPTPEGGSWNQQTFQQQMQAYQQQGPQGQLFQQQQDSVAPGSPSQWGAGAVGGPRASLVMGRGVNQSPVDGLGATGGVVPAGQHASLARMNSAPVLQGQATQAAIASVVGGLSGSGSMSSSGGLSGSASPKQSPVNPANAEKVKGKGFLGMLGIKNTSQSKIVVVVREKSPSYDVIIDGGMFSGSPREKLVFELLATERSYVEGLRLMLSYFVDDPTCPLTEADKKTIFSNAEQIYQFHVNLLDDLTMRLRTWHQSPDTKIGDIFIKYYKFLQMYPAYCGNFEAAQDYFVQLRKKNKKLTVYCTTRIPDCNGLDLSSLLITPVQRVPRYVMLLTDLVKRTEPTHGDYATLQEALAKIQESAGGVNTGISNMEKKSHWETACTQVAGLTALVAPHRNLVKDGFVSATFDRSTVGYLFLVTDLVILASGPPTQPKQLAKATTPLAGQVSEADMDKMSVVGKFDLATTMISRTSDSVLQFSGAEQTKCDVNFGDEVATTRWMQTLQETATKWLEPQRDESVEVHPGVWRFKNGNIFRSMPSTDGSIMQPANLSGQGTMEYTNSGEAYKGGWLDNQHHGQGTLKTRDGVIFEGLFDVGSKVNGRMTWPDGSYYHGDFSKNLFHGAGVFSEANNTSLYTGEWQHGRRHGLGKWEMTYGGRKTEYDGDWVQDHREGQGTLRSASGRVYQGAWDKDQRHGRGVLKFVADSGEETVLYDGNWANDLRHGEGVEHAPGATYQGGFANDLRHGQGQLQFCDGSRYVGAFENGRQHGQGTWTSADGRTVYTGGFQNDMYHGEGKLVVNGTISNVASETAPGVSVYTGAWSEGRRTGKGTQRYVDGSTYQGGWSKNQRHGFGKFTTATSGFIYEGVWKNDLRGGTGSAKFRNTSVEASFENGLPKGPGDIKFNDGRMSHVEFSGGGSVTGVTQLRDGTGRVLSTSMIRPDGSTDTKQSAGTNAFPASLPPPTDL